MRVFCGANNFNLILRLLPGVVSDQLSLPRPEVYRGATPDPPPEVVIKGGGGPAMAEVVIKVGGGPATELSCPPLLLTLLWSCGHKVGEVEIAPNGAS